jgi:AcrR family transcriptional regulator
MTSARHAQTQARRRNILDAALALFLERGVSETTADDIRARSGVSVGSLYHHFAGGKDDVAAALYLETIAEYQAGFLAELRRHRQAATGVRATVRYHLRWVEAHRDAARFLFNYGDLELRSPTDDGLAQLNARLVTEVHHWATDVGAEELTNLQVDVATAIWIGPAQQFARRWLAGGTTTSIARAARLLAAGASAALLAATFVPSAIDGTRMEQRDGTNRGRRHDVRTNRHATFPTRLGKPRKTREE